MMTELTPLQQKVFDAVKEWGSTKPWFRGVCMDNFPEDDEIESNFDDAVTGVCFETAMWDDPNFYNTLGQHHD